MKKTWKKQPQTTKNPEIEILGKQENETNSFRRVFFTYMIAKTCT